MCIVGCLAAFPGFYLIDAGASPGGTISSASGRCQIVPGGESQLVENHRPKGLNLNRGLGRKKEFCFRSADALFQGTVEGAEC